MKLRPFYSDMHIHSYADANNRDGAIYNHAELLSKVAGRAKGCDALISITDHNVINASAYNAISTDKPSSIHVLLGVEVTVSSNGKKPYHAHLYFSTSPTDMRAISEINAILDNLYPNKLPSIGKDKIPTLPVLVNAFRNYDFLFLPHGGQSHMTFDNAVQDGELFDDLMLRSVYYNTFDGFTARSDTNVAATEDYFRRLGISDFTNLLTGSDNYKPELYPAPKNPDSADFMPTWVFAKPTFEGLRLALSEKSRLAYSKEEPDSFITIDPSIEHIELNNDLIDMDVDLSAGLNVIIGGSSSGKTLLTESIARATGAIGESDYSACYNKFKIDEVSLSQISGTTPYYINQSYISKVVDKSVNRETIDSIQILKDVFPQDQKASEELDTSFASVRTLVSSLFTSADVAQTNEAQLRRLLPPCGLLTTGSTGSNPITAMRPTPESAEAMNWDAGLSARLDSSLKELTQEFAGNPLLDPINNEVGILRAAVARGKATTKMHEAVNAELAEFEKAYSEVDSTIKARDQKKIDDFKTVLTCAAKLRSAYSSFNKSKNDLLAQRFDTVPRTSKLAGHTLCVIYSFEMAPELLLEAINKLIISEKQFGSVDEITPETLSLEKVDKRFHVASMAAFGAKVASELETKKTRTFKILTKNGKDWSELSEGRKTAVLLDLILGYRQNSAPLIIDQPEDNLAADYINNGLSEAIKNSKSNRQTIIVTHNATIPMLADAQTVVLCRQVNNKKLVIRSAPLEGSIDGKRMLDWIAEITDGGKSSVQKRIRKYNFRKFEN